MSDAAEKLAALRAQREALADAAAARLEVSDDEAVAIEEKLLAEDLALDKAQSEHGAKAVRLVRTDVGAVIVRRPHVAAYRKFQDGESSTQVTEELVKSCLLYPSKSEWDKLMNVQPGVLTKVANACVELAGFRLSDVKGK